MYYLTMIAMVCALPAALLGLALNVAHMAINRPSAARVTLRLIVLLASWLALFAVLRWDPGSVVEWLGD